jgi:hypothetical protein
MLPSLDCSELVILASAHSKTEPAYSVVFKIDTRVLPSRIVSGVFNKQFLAPAPMQDYSMGSVFTTLHQVEDLIELYERRMQDPCRIKWMTFNNKLSRNMIMVLAEKLAKKTG